MEFFIDDKNIALEGIISHLFDLGPSFYFFEKTGNFYLFLKTFFPNFPKTKSETWFTPSRP